MDETIRNSTRFYRRALKKIGLALLVEFSTNTLASLVYFAITVVANNMRSLGLQTTDVNGREN